MVAVWSCGGRLDSRLERADALVCADPEAALCVLDSIDELELNGDNLAWLGLLRAKAKDKNHVSVRRDPLLDFAVRYYSGRKDSFAVQSLYYQGLGMCHTSQFDSALLQLNQSYKLAGATGDIFYQAMSTRELANCYRCLLLHDKHLEYSQKSKELFLECNRESHAAWMDIDIIHALTYTGKLSEALNMCDSVDSMLFSISTPFRQRVIKERIQIYSLLKRHADIISHYDTLRADGYKMKSGDWCLVAESCLDEGRLNEANAARDSVVSLPLTEANRLYLELIDARISIGKKEYELAATQALKWGYDLLIDEEKSVPGSSVSFLADWLSTRVDAQEVDISSTRTYAVLIGVILVLSIAILCFIINILRRRHENSKNMVARQNIEILDLSSRLRQAGDDAHKLMECIDQHTEALSRMTEDRDILRSRLKDLESSNTTIQENLMDRIDNYIEVIESQNSEIARYQTFAESARSAIKEYNNELLSDVSEIVRLWQDYLFMPSKKMNADLLYKKTDKFIKSFRDKEQIGKLIKIMDYLNDGRMAGFMSRYGGIDPKIMNIIKLRYLNFPHFAIMIIEDYKSSQNYYSAKSRYKKQLIELYGEDMREFLKNISF